MTSIIHHRVMLRDLGRLAKSHSYQIVQASTGSKDTDEAAIFKMPGFAIESQ